MPKSQRLRLHEIRQVHELIDHITEFGDRPDIWRQIALEGLTRLVGGNMALTVDFRMTPEGIPLNVDPLDSGWQTESVRHRYYEYVTSGEMAEDPGVIGLLEQQKLHRFLTATRRQLVDDGPWYDSPTVSEARRMGDVDDLIVTSIELKPGITQGFVVYRPWGAKPFEPRQRRIVRLFHIGLARAIQRSDEPKPIFGPMPHLSPRLKQTLELMLTPMSAKEIAAELRLSRFTINDYQKALYRIFDVTNRMALVCKFRPMKRQIRLPDGLL
jgi:DNA-binding CsgD family transcriptional regulator